MCSSKLRVKNKEVNSLIGGLGAGFGALLLISWFSARNVLFSALTAIFFAMVMVILLLLVDKYVKVELESGSKIDKLPI
jgi:ABC-type Fe3+-siderophore transport system permease subunit